MTDRTSSSPGTPSKLEDILALDGMGTITVTPSSLPIENKDGAPAPMSTSPAETIAARDTNEPERDASAFSTAPNRGAASLQSPAERLKATLARHKNRTGNGNNSPPGYNKSEADFRQETAQQFASVDDADGIAQPTQAWQQGEPPIVQRIVEPKKVEYTRPSQPSPHVKLSDLPVNPSGRNAARLTEAPKPAGGSTQASRAGATGAQTTGSDGFRHLPDAVRGKLEAFTSPTGQAPPELSVAGTNTGASATPGNGASSISAPSFASLPGGGELKDAILASRRAFFAAGLFSLVINLLMLAGPLFMLQVYDRVMTSGSIPTLVVLFAMTAGLYGVLGLLELARSRIIVRVGVEVDQRISDRIYQAVLRRSLTAPDATRNSMRDHDNLRSFLAGPGPLTFFDAPWTPAYLLIIFALHWVLGLAATIGGMILITLALVSEFRSRAPLAEASRTAAASLDLADTGQRNAEALTSMGMMNAYRARWQEANGKTLGWQVLVADRLGSISAVSKSLRLLMQSTMLAIGAVLALQNEISAGTIVAASIIFGRALAPVEQAIGQWRPFVRAREAYARLSDLLAKVPAPKDLTKLPAPAGHLSVDNLRVAAPDTRQLILANINFNVTPGGVLAVIGPSASGKSTLARSLVGLWPPFGGSIRIDGSQLDQWDPEDLGQHIGYLPQNVELFSGTVRENIARFRTDVSDDAVIEAARAAHAHELILALPHGYDTQLGSFGAYLSGGQRQRLGLARALFGNPALVVLDEPNANLDRQGDEALDGAIEGMRSRRQTVVLISHRVGAISKADTLLYIDRGMQRAFGPRDEVMKMIRGAGAQPATQAGERVGASGTDRATNPNARKGSINRRLKPANKPGIQAPHE